MFKVQLNKIATIQILQFSILEFVTVCEKKIKAGKIPASFGLQIGMRGL